MKLKYFAIGLIVCSLLTSKIHAQDIQFGDPKQVIQFYNQSIIEETKSSVRFNFRDVKVQRLSAFKSGIGMLTIPLAKRNESTTSNKIFATVGGGFNQ